MPPPKKDWSPKNPNTTHKKGLLEDGQWLCDCTPRKPAACLTVKKGKANKGKRFYTCHDNPKKCKFFLWEEEARQRELDALILHNCQSENGITTSVRAKTPEPAPPLKLPEAKTTARPIYEYFKKPGPKQKIFKELDASRAGYHENSGDLVKDMGTANGAAQVSSQSNPPVQHRSQVPQCPEAISQTIRNSTSSTSLGSEIAPVDTAGCLERRSAKVYPVTPTAKRKRNVFQEDSDEEFGGDDLNDPETARQLAAITDESARKQQRTRDVYETPAPRRAPNTSSNNESGLLTPVSRKPGLLIASDERERSAKRQRRGDTPHAPGHDGGQDQVQPNPQHVLGDPETPTPCRKVDALAGCRNAAAAARAALADGYPSISDEVLSLLDGQPISESTKRTLRAALERHEMRIKGILLGREAARVRIAERDATIGELQGRVLALENGRRMDRDRLRELSSGLLKLSQED